MFFNLDEKKSVPPRHDLSQMKFPREIMQYILKIKSLQAWKERKHFLYTEVDMVMSRQFLVMDYTPFMLRVTVMITPCWEFVCEEGLNVGLYIKRVLNLKITTRPKPLYLDIEYIPRPITHLDDYSDDYSDEEYSSDDYASSEPWL